MIEITEEKREQLKAMGITDEDINNLIASSDPAQKYDFKYENGKILTSKTDYSQIADYLINKYRISKILGVPHVYTEGVYRYLSDDEFDIICINELYNTTINRRKDIKKYVSAMAESKRPSHERYILFKNGVYDVKDKKLLPKSPEYVFCNIIPHNYNEKAKKQQIFDDFIISLSNGDEETAILLKQMIGYCFYRKNPLQEFFFLLGTGGNGKSTFLEFLAYLIGYENTSYLTTDDLRNGFNVPLLKNKLLNIGDDVENGYLDSVSILKKIVSGEQFTAAGKYKEPEPISFYGKALFSGNEVPKTSDKSNGLKRRTNIVPLLNTFTKKTGEEKRDINILEKLKNEEVAEYCIKECMKSLEYVLEHRCFSLPKIVVEAGYEYAKENDAVLEFIEENEDIVLEKECATVYTIYYKRFCNDCGYRPLGRNNFYKQMRAAGYVNRQRDDAPGRPWMFCKVQEN